VQQIPKLGLFCGATIACECILSKNTNFFSVLFYVMKTQINNVEISVLGNLKNFSSLAMNLFLYPTITFWRILFTLFMTLLDGTRPEKSNGISCRVIGHTIYTLEQCANCLRTLCSPCITLSRFCLWPDSEAVAKGLGSHIGFVLDYYPNQL
jgi:hypothetical protein